MARTTKKDITIEEVKPIVEAPEPKAKANVKTETEISPLVDRLLRLNSQYKVVYITPNGFVHTEAASPKILATATRYENKYYKQ